MVNRRVSGVVELAGQDGAGSVLNDLSSLSAGPRHTGGAWGEHQLSAQQTNNGATLLGHRLRHGDDDFVAASRTDKSETNTGISGGGLDDSASRLKLTGGFGGVNDRLRNTVLNAGGRVVELELGQHSGSGVREQLINLNQRGVTDKLGNVVSDLCHDDQSFRLAIW